MPTLMQTPELLDYLHSCDATTELAKTLAEILMQRRIEILSGMAPRKTLRVAS